MSSGRLDSEGAFLGSLSQGFRIEAFNEYLPSLCCCINELVSMTNYYESLSCGRDSSPTSLENEPLDFLQHLMICISLLPSLFFTLCSRDLYPFIHSFFYWTNVYWVSTTCWVMVGGLGIHLRTKPDPCSLELRHLVSLRVGSPVPRLGNFPPCFPQAHRPEPESCLPLPSASCHQVLSSSLCLASYSLSFLPPLSCIFWGIL